MLLKFFCQAKKCKTSLALNRLWFLQRNQVKFLIKRYSTCENISGYFKSKMADELVYCSLQINSHYFKNENVERDAENPWGALVTKELIKEQFSYWIFIATTVLEMYWEGNQKLIYLMFSKDVGITEPKFYLRITSFDRSLLSTGRFLWAFA